jgi:hypothetical protein
LQNKNHSLCIGEVVIVFDILFINNFYAFKAESDKDQEVEVEPGGKLEVALTELIEGLGFVGVAS